MAAIKKIRVDRTFSTSNDTEDKGSVSVVQSARQLSTARNINGVAFDGTSNITVTANTTNALTIGTGLSGTSYNGSSAVTIALANTAVTAGSYGSSSAIPVITVDAQGRITAASTSAVSIPSGSISVTGGDLTLSGTTGTAITNATLANSGVTAGTYTKITVDAKGRATAGASATTTDIAEGTNLYYTDVRARASKSAGTGISYNSTTGVISTVQDIATTASPTFAAITTTGNGSIGGNLTVTGNLTVNGTTETLNSTTITIADKNIELGVVTTPTNTTADGGGITVKGATDKTWNWVNATGAWTSSEHIAAAAGKNIFLNGSTSGTVTITVPAIAGTNTITLPAVTGTVVTTGDTGSVTNTMLAGSIATSKITGLAASATTDTTNAANITSGTLPAGRLPAFTGDATSTAGTSALTLATVNANVGAFGSSTAVPIITVNAKGLVTGVTTANISGSLTFTGDVTGSGSTGTSTALTLANSGVTAGTYTLATVTVDAKGRITSASNGSAAGGAVSSFNTRTGAVTLTSADVTTALNYTPLNSAGGTMSGELSIGTGTKVSFGSQTRQMIDLWSNVYGIGVQSSTLYYRSGSRFSWHRGGSHNDAENNPGGGTVAMTLDGSSNLTVTNGVYAAFYQTSSDIRLKSDITESPYGLSAVLELRPVKYIKGGRKEVGLIAQEVETIIPEMVHTNPDEEGMKSINYPQLVSVLIKAVQELKAEVDTLKAKLGE